MKVYSTIDSRGMVYVDCTECNRGKNGNDDDKCSSGWNIKKHGHGCFNGVLLPSVAKELGVSTIKKS